MHTVPISNLQRQLGMVSDLAMKEPIAITRNSKERYVFMSYDEYQRLKRRDREVLGVEELSEEDVRDIAAAQVPAEYEYLNELLEE